LKVKADFFNFKTTELNDVCRPIDDVIDWNTVDGQKQEARTSVDQGDDGQQQPEVPDLVRDQSGDGRDNYFWIIILKL
jgi:hypothetical protein